MTFNGYFPETLTFLTELAANNNKSWFDSHRTDYDTYVLEPSRDFVIALGERLRQLAPNVMADPRINKSIFRIHKDTRFSKDKEGGAKFDHPGYYLHLDSDNMMLGAGIHGFSKPLLALCGVRPKR